MNREEFEALLKEAVGKFGRTISIGLFYDFARKKGYKDWEVRYWLKKWNGWKFDIANWNIIVYEEEEHE